MRDRSIFTGWFVALMLAQLPAAGAQDATTSTLAGPDRTGAVTDLSPWLEEQRAEAELPALAGGVASSRSVLALGVSGVRKAGEEEAATLDDLWHVGSISKSFTSLLAARLIEREGVGLGFEHSLATLWPELAADSRYRAVTLEQLLSHTSGLPANPELRLLGAARQDARPLPEQRRTMVEALLAMAPVHEPGGGFLYSNAGFVTAGSVLEHNTGKAWEDLVEAHVFEPLGLASAGFGAPGTTGTLDQPRGHLLQSSGAHLGIEPGPLADNPAVLGPAGTIHMTLPDLLRYTQAHLRGELRQDQSGLLPADVWQRLHRRLDGHAYALGWAVFAEHPAAGGQRVIWHNGSNTMWYAVIALVPESDLALSLVSNAPIAKGPEIDEIFARLVSEWRSRTP